METYTMSFKHLDWIVKKYHKEAAANKPNPKQQH